MLDICRFISTLRYELKKTTIIIKDSETRLRKEKILIEIIGNPSMDDLITTPYYKKIIYFTVFSPAHNMN